MHLRHVTAAVLLLTACTGDDVVPTGDAVGDDSAPDTTGPRVDTFGGTGDTHDAGFVVDYQGARYQMVQLRIAGPDVDVDGDGEPDNGLATLIDELGPLLAQVLPVSIPITRGALSSFVTDLLAEDDLLILMETIWSPQIPRLTAHVVGGVQVDEALYGAPDDYTDGRPTHPLEGTFVDADTFDVAGDRFDLVFAYEPFVPQVTITGRDVRASVDLAGDDLEGRLAMLVPAQTTIEQVVVPLIDSYPGFDPGTRDLIKALARGAAEDFADKELPNGEAALSVALTFFAQPRTWSDPPLPGDTGTP